MTLLFDPPLYYCPEFGFLLCLLDLLQVNGQFHTFTMTNFLLDTTIRLIHGSVYLAGDSSTRLVSV